MHWDFALILVVLGAAVPLAGRRRVRQLMQLPATTKIDRLSIYSSTIASQITIAAVILWRATAHGWRAPELGLSIPRPALTAAIAILLSLLIFVNQIFSIRRLATHPAGIKGLLPQLALKVFPQDGAERLVFFALVCTVAVCEELIYRGFVQHVAQEFGPDSLMWGIVVSSVFFAFAHLYQGGRGLLSTFLVGVVFASVRFWTGSLLPTISAHFVADLTVGLLAPGRLRAALAAQPADPVSPAASAEDNPS